MQIFGIMLIKRRVGYVNTVRSRQVKKSITADFVTMKTYYATLTLLANM